MTSLAWEMNWKRARITKMEKVACEKLKKEE